MACHYDLGELTTVLPAGIEGDWLREVCAWTSLTLIVWASQQSTGAMFWRHSIWPLFYLCFRSHDYPLDAFASFAVRLLAVLRKRALRS